MARLKRQLPVSVNLNDAGLPIGFAMARLKRLDVVIRYFASVRLTDRIRDGAIETIYRRLSTALRSGGLPIGFAMARLKRIDSRGCSADCSGLPIGFAMARLKLSLSRHRRIFGSWLTDRIRDGAIETSRHVLEKYCRLSGLPIGFAMARLKHRVHSSTQFPRCQGLPIGFAMARLKRVVTPTAEANLQRLTDRIRDGAIETSVRLISRRPPRFGLTDRIRDGAIETFR